MLKPVASGLQSCAGLVLIQFEVDLMLSASNDPSSFCDWSDFIDSANVRDAFAFLVGLAAGSGTYNCKTQWKGAVRDFRFYDAGEQQPFSFITNKKSLKFYFRKPSLKYGCVKRQDIAAAFDTFSENPAGEYTVSLHDINDVLKLRAFVPAL
ncbi:MAG: hypothetical protein AAF662_05495 [Pseudomonadota bacterium]